MAQPVDFLVRLPFSQPNSKTRCLLVLTVVTGCCNFRLWVVPGHTMMSANCRLSEMSSALQASKRCSGLYRTIFNRAFNINQGFV
eukprot:6952570-Pyramimonas_sp.AAC.1